MSNLMKLLGTILALLGVVLVGLYIAQPGHLQVYGVTLDTGVLLLVGGILAVGLGGVIDAFRGPAPRKEAVTVGAVTVQPVSDNVKSGGFFKKPEISPAAEVVATAAATVAGISSDEAEVAVKGASAQVSDTINALEQAKQDIMKSMGGMDDTTGKDEDSALDRPGPEDQVVTEPAESAAGAEGLYVVEEKVIRGRPARILSDDTIEAETDEGWMRFEDFDHLNEYLDSMEEQAS